MDDETKAAPPIPGKDFIRQIVAEDGRGGKERRARADAVSARAERLPAHRPREVDLPRFRRRRGVRRHLQPALRRHESRAQGRDEYVERIKDDVHWLGFDWEDRLFYASDYFAKLYEFAAS